jgi:Flp pilus assembly protein TadB
VAGGLVPAPWVEAATVTDAATISSASKESRRGSPRGRRPARRLLIETTYRSDHTDFRGVRRSRPVRVTGMNDATTVFIEFCWLAWLVYWVIMALATKRTIERGGVIGYCLVAIVIVAGLIAAVL